jgi:hypothetical protein
VNGKQDTLGISSNFHGQVGVIDGRCHYSVWLTLDREIYWLRLHRWFNSSK